MIEAVDTNDPNAVRNKDNLAVGGCEQGLDLVAVQVGHGGFVEAFLRYGQDLLDLACSGWRSAA